MRRLRTRIAATIALVPLLAAGSIAIAAPAVHAAPAPQCSFATEGTGTYARTLCWLDMSGYSAAQATSPSGQQMTLALPGGYSLSFTLNVTGGPVAPHALPTYPAAYLGNNGHYSGVTDKPALYQTSQGTKTVATLTNIVARDPGGSVVPGYALVGADAESTDSNESITWNASTTIQSLTQTSSGNGLGNACAGGFSGIGTNTVTCIGSGSTVKTGTAIVDAEVPSSFSQTMVGSGLQAVAFGILVSTVQLNKEVVNGFAGDSFAVTVSSNDGSVLATADTNGTSTASTGQITLLTSPSGEPYHLSEAATSGLQSNYDRSWSCTRDGATDPSLPSGDAGASASVQVGIGDFVDCTITNSAKPATLSLVKHAAAPVDVNHDGLVDEGDTIQYSFTVTNTGVLALSDIAVSDPRVGSVTCPEPTLAPNASELCTADDPYVITAADVNAGEVTNTATATGTPPGATVPIDSNQSETDTPTQAPSASLSLVKSASPSLAAGFVQGEKITYSFVVTNTGNVPLSSLSVSEDSFTGSGSMSAISCPVTELAVDAQTVCTATYTVTAADAATGHLDNEATAYGTPPNSTTPVPSDPSAVTVPTDAAPEISLTKAASPTTVTHAGQSIAYSFKVTNTGNVDLGAVAIAETAFTGAGASPAAVCPLASLVPGQFETCTATYTVTQADLDAGKPIDNTATSSGIPPGTTAPVVSAPSSATVAVEQHPAISLHKSADVETVTTAGDVITYSFEVSNTGNVTLSDIGVTESSFNGHGSLTPLDCPAGTGPLAPGGTLTCAAAYTVTTADLGLSAIVNTAVAAGDPPDGAARVTSDPSTARVTVTPITNLPVVAG